METNQAALPARGKGIPSCGISRVMETPTGGARPRGRYAPTPSGFLHVGNARTALVAWLSARSVGGSFVMRVEDLDGPRTVVGAAQGALDDLAWLGLDWQEGPDLGGPHEPYVQSLRSAHYEHALAQLAGSGRLFPCGRSRKDLRQLATAPHGGSGGGPPAYPAAWRPPALAEDWFERFRAAEGPEKAIRFKVHGRPVRFEDRLQGEWKERVDRTVGDFVLKRRDGVWAYQLAVVVDDLAMGVTEVVRGVDLLESTGRQIQLIEALGGRPPAYGHVPLVLNAEGEKLSKRDAGLTLVALREAGVHPHRLVGAFAHSLGLRDSAAPRSAASLVPDFAWSRLHRRPWRLPADFESRIRGI